MRKLLTIFLVLLLAVMAADATRTTITAVAPTIGTAVNGANLWTATTSSGMLLTSIMQGNQLLIINTTVTSSSLWGINLTMKKGVGQYSVLGDKIYTLSRNQTYIIGPLSTSRFEQNNNTFLFDFNASRGKLIAVNLP